MDNAKHAPLIWDFFKLITAIFITMAIASVVYWRIPLHDFLQCSGSAILSLMISMSQLTAFLAGLWGYQAIRNSCKVTGSKWIRACLVMNIIVAVCCVIAMLFSATILIALSMPGSLLFFLLVVQTTITAFFLRGRYFLHLLTVWCLLAAHLLFWYLALEIAGAA